MPQVFAIAIASSTSCAVSRRGRRKFTASAWCAIQSSARLVCASHSASTGPQSVSTTSSVSLGPFATSIVSVTRRAVPVPSSAAYVVFDASVQRTRAQSIQSP